MIDSAYSGVNVGESLVHRDQPSRNADRDALTGASYSLPADREAGWLSDGLAGILRASDAVQLAAVVECLYIEACVASGVTQNTSAR